jgi:hypothetical protein
MRSFQAKKAPSQRGLINSNIKRSKAKEALSRTNPRSSEVSEFSWQPNLHEALALWYDVLKGRGGGQGRGAFSFSRYRETAGPFSKHIHLEM